MNFLEIIRGEFVLNLFLPNKQVYKPFEIEPKFLQDNNIKGIIVDVDNTLVPWDVAHATEEVINWLEEMKAANIKVTIFSNNNKERVTLFADPLDTPYIYKARKPLGHAFERARKQMELEKWEIAVIGDQLLTDILGGNRAGYYTILVDPLVTNDAKITTFNRNVERMILNHFYRKGKLKRRVMDQ